MRLSLAKRITRPVQALAAAAGGSRRRAACDQRIGSRRPTTSSARWSMRSTAMASNSQNQPGAKSIARRWNSNATRGSRRAPPLHRNDPGARRDRRRVGRRQPASSPRSMQAAMQLLGLEPSVVGQSVRLRVRAPRSSADRRADDEHGGARGSGEPSAQEVAISKARQTAGCRRGDSGWSRLGESSGRIVLRARRRHAADPAQKVATWREVARRLAHGMKPLAPIQLSAERLRRHFASAPPNAEALVDDARRQSSAKSNR